MKKWHQGISNQNRCVKSQQFFFQLVASRERLAMLEKHLEDPSDESRVRLLGGDDPEPEILAKKIEELELRLAEKEEKLLEKDLIFEEVTRLADRTKKKSESGKEDTLELAKKVCLVHDKLLTELQSSDCYISWLMITVILLTRLLEGVPYCREQSFLITLSTKSSESHCSLNCLSFDIFLLAFPIFQLTKKLRCTRAKF